MDAQHAVDIVTLANELTRYKEVDVVAASPTWPRSQKACRAGQSSRIHRIVKDKSLLRS